ncbi:MAG: aspartate aminotransferase family protein [Haloferacaceae archaeon]
MDRDRAEPSVGSVPGARAERWIDYHRRAAATSTHAYGFVWDPTAEAAGPFCTDVDGNVFLDFTSHVASNPLGYDHPALAEKLDAIDLPTPTKVAGQSFYTGAGPSPDDAAVPGPARLMDLLTERTDRYGLDTVFLSNSGAEAVENALKICYDHRPGARRGITFQGAFHGRTLGALSCNRSKAAHRRGFPELPGVHDVPYCTDQACTPATCDCGFFPGDDPDGSRLRTLLGEGGALAPSDVAFVIVEPVQGEGGYRFPSAAFAEELADVCAAHDIPLIADEVQTGIGRTGRWWGSDHYPFEPDVIASAKALQVGATVSREEVFPEERSRISSTWGGGDLVAALQGALTIEVIEEEGLLANARERGADLRARLRDRDLGPVTDVRGKGLMVAVEFDSPERRDAVVGAALDRGLLTLGCGRRTVRLLPPLDVTDREVGLGVRLLADAVGATADGASPDVAGTGGET